MMNRSIPASALSPDESCGLYLAKSTIPNAGVGIFTTRALSKGSFAGYGDICIPVVNQKYYVDKNTFFWPFSEYVWTGDSMGMQLEARSRSVSAFCTSFNSAVNCHLGLINVKKASPEFESGGVHRSRDPGAGAFTPYHNATTPVIADVPAGGELYKHYGNNWFVSRTNKFGLLPLTKDYAEAERIVKKFDGLALPSEQIRKNLWKLITVDVPWESRTTNALPKDYENMMTVARNGIRSIHQPSAIRDVNYLRKYGRCLDHIQPGKRSTIKQAGHGAFASHYLPKGTIISASPLLPVVERDYLNIYRFEDMDGDGKQEKRTDEIIGMQLLLNYCFGHPESTLLLCPYGAGVNYINHNQTRANVKIQWAPDGIISHNASWLETMSVDDMKWKYSTNLAIEYVALKDIRPGDEIFLDYGDAWEEAWQQHLKKWRAPPDSSNYAPAMEWNMEMQNAPIRTSQEQQKDPYPPNIGIRCHSKLLEDNWKQRLLLRPRWPLSERGVACVIRSRYFGSMQNGTLEMYDVILYDQESRKSVAREGIPRDFLLYVDSPHSTDFQLKNAFRHELRFPDGMFPSKWRNLQTPGENIVMDEQRNVESDFETNVAKPGGDIHALETIQFWLLFGVVALVSVTLRKRLLGRRGNRKKNT